MGNAGPLSLFEGVGVEIEYMIVDRESLDVLPICDRVMEAESGEITSEIEHDDITWNNELVLHVIELKTTEPVRTLDGLSEAFARHVARVHALLEPLGGRLMPTAMHPWMDPHASMKLWPHEASDIYDTFHRIFDCRGHGWANLQSLHINLPFANDEEFGRLHAAIRLLLPILPALAASSPIMDGRATEILDNRLAVYRNNCRRVPSVTGRVIPEPVFTREAYDGMLHGIYADMKPLDPEGVLAHEWINARGAIARFDRGSIEIRVLDVQDCPAADVAIVAVVIGVLKMLADESWASLDEQMRWSVEDLAIVYETVVREGETAVIEDMSYLKSLGVSKSTRCTTGELWRHLIDSVARHDSTALEPHLPALEVILERGPLARRLLRELPNTPDRQSLLKLYQRLCDGLNHNCTFQGRD